MHTAFPNIYAVYVAPAYRRQGIARELIRAAIAESLKAGRTAIRLWVSPDNISAVTLYRSMGFVACDGGDKTDTMMVHPLNQEKR